MRNSFKIAVLLVSSLAIVSSVEAKPRKAKVEATSSQNDFLLQEKVLLVQGTAFNWPNKDHFRIVFLPREDDLTKAIQRFGNFLSRYSQ